MNGSVLYQARNVAFTPLSSIQASKQKSNYKIFQKCNRHFIIFF